MRLSLLIIHEVNVELDVANYFHMINDVDQETWEIALTCHSHYYNNECRATEPQVQRIKDLCTPDNLIALGAPPLILAKEGEYSTAVILLTTDED